MTDKTFLGQGWAFPFRLDETGETAMARYEQDVREAIFIILATNHGERVMRPDFGANLQAMVFAPMNTTTLALVRHRVEEALVRWEPRIDQVTVTVRAEHALGRLLVDINYRIRVTNTFYNLVYPFYLLESRES